MKINSIEKMPLLPKNKIRTSRPLSSAYLWTRFTNQYRILTKRNGKAPTRKLLFHLTDSKSARKIAAEGFDLSRAQTSAFGKGINLCSDFKDVLKYASRVEKPVVLICEVLVGKACANSSDLNTLVKNSDGALYSKPLFVKPPPGYDAFYSKKPLKKIWVIPSSARVYPSFLVVLK